MPSPTASSPFAQLTIPYPKNRVELSQWFGTDVGCLNYIDSLRWANGFVCPKCGGNESWRPSPGLRRCKSCRYRASVTAGTIFNDTRKPLPAWFEAIWHICGQKSGGSALALQKALGLGSYHTAWAWLHRMRRAMVMPGRTQLNGEVEVDETFVGGVKPRIRGRGAAGKTLVLIAAEVRGVAIGRIRLQVIPDASAAALLPAVSSLVETGSDIVTDGWTAYLGLPKLGYNHTISRATQAMGNNLLPHVHRIASLLKRWLLGTHQGAVSHDLLQCYLDEFVFRFNRRSSGSRGLIFLTLLQQSLNHVPVTKSNMNPTALKSASLGAHASPLPHGLDASQDVLREFARKYIWWLTPEEALEFPMRIVCQTMNIGLFDDVARLTDSVGEEAMRSALTNAEVGQFNPRSWHYWHYRLGIATPGQVPAMPVKSFLT